MGIDIQNRIVVTQDHAIIPVSSILKAKIETIRSSYSDGGGPHTKVLISLRLTDSLQLIAAVHLNEDVGQFVYNLFAGWLVDHTYNDKFIFTDEKNAMLDYVASYKDELIKSITKCKKRGYKHLIKEIESKEFNNMTEFWNFRNGTYRGYSIMEYWASK